MSSNNGGRGATKEIMEVIRANSDKKCKTKI